MNARILHRWVLLLASLATLVWVQGSNSFVHIVRGGRGPSESLAWSPDGTQIVFSARMDNGSMEIFVMDANGSNLRNLSNSPEDYLRFGAKMVWLVFPDEKRVEVNVPGQDVREVDIDGILDGGDVLPGFTLPVHDIFPK